MGVAAWPYRASSIPVLVRGCLRPLELGRARARECDKALIDSDWAINCAEKPDKVRGSGPVPTA